MDSLITTFHIDWKLIVAQMVNFAVVFVVLYWFALRPLAKLMGERKEEIEKGLTDAKTNAEMLMNTKAEYEKALTEARREGATIITAAKKDAETEKARILASAKSDADTLIAQGKQTLEAEKAKMLESAKTELATLVVKATEKVLEGTVTGPVESALVEKSIKEVSA
jgi:F-type H+-transporting ATPase subunit b